MKLTIVNGCFSYAKDKPVINNLNFSASSGELIAVLGPNGAGKTTLLRCMMGFLKWKTGKSLLDGEEIRLISARRLWQRISYVPQARGAFSSLPVGQMILLGRTNRLSVFSAPGAEDFRAVRAVMQRLHIEGLNDKRCNEISGGELQMVLIARALVSEPELLILDEPESNLDFKNQLIILNTLSELAANGMCCIFNTHYPSHALTRATKSLMLTSGGEALFGDTADIVTEENIRKAFGVEAVIGEVETPGNVYKNIIPIRVTAADGCLSDDSENRRVIAVIGLIFSGFAVGERINALFHEYRGFLVGRMGMPYREAGVYIINATLDAPEREIRALSHKLSVLPGVSVKTTFATPGEENDNDEYRID